MSAAKSHPIKHKSDHPHVTEDGLDSAKSGLYSERTMGKDALPTTRSYLMHRKQSCMVYKMVLIWVITKGQNFKHWDSIVFCFCRCINVLTSRVLYWECPAADRYPDTTDTHNYPNLSQSCTVYVNDFKQLTTLWWCTSTLPQFLENSL